MATSWVISRSGSDMPSISTTMGRPAQSIPPRMFHAVRAAAISAGVSWSP